MTERRTYNERRSFSARVMRWRQAIYEPREGMPNGCRLLLLRLSDDMDAVGKVSIPRRELAEHMGVAPARITEWITIARKLGFIDTVRRGRPGVTAVYAGTIPPSEVRLGVPSGDEIEVRQSRPSEVREGVPSEGPQRYARTGTQEVVANARAGTSRDGDPGDVGLEEKTTPSSPSFLMALETSSIDCPHGLPFGDRVERWNDEVHLTCPDCHAAYQKSEGRRTA